MGKSYIVASSKDWNYNTFVENVKAMDGSWEYVSDPGALDTALNATNPRYIFFLHWSWIVPNHIHERYECVVFHMTDLPFGRGGSPLQNLILRGIKETKVSALKMTNKLDAGPIYLKKPLKLNGRALDIYKEVSKLCWLMIKEIIMETLKPIPQTGSPVSFKRRKPEESEIPTDISYQKMYDFIRMLDAPTYPHAFIDYGNIRLHFTDAKFNGNDVVASVRIKQKKEHE